MSTSLRTTFIIGTFTFFAVLLGDFRLNYDKKNGDVISKRISSLIMASSIACGIMGLIYFYFNILSNIRTIKVTK